MPDYLLCNFVEVAFWWDDLTTDAWQRFSKKRSNLKHMDCIMTEHNRDVWKLYEQSALTSTCTDLLRETKGQRNHFLPFCLSYVLA